MRVAFISLFRSGQGGGEGRVAHELARHFAESHDVVMICPGDETRLFDAQRSGLRVFGVRSAGDGEFQMPALSARTVRTVFDFLDAFSPDVVHAHEPALIGLIGQIWARMHRVPFVHTSHVLPTRALDFGATDALDMRVLQGSFSQLISRRLLTDFYGNCDAIIALNQPALNSLREFGYAGRIYIIPNGRDLSRYTDCAEADRETAQKVLSFVGYLSERKNQTYLIEAHRHLPDQYRLVLLGKALKPGFEEQLKQHCRAHGLTNVTFAGQVPHDEIPSHLERTHVVVSASKMEVQSLVVIEALASGTPVVGLSNETIDELVDHRVGCWLPKETPPDQFAANVQRICNLSRSQYEKMCRNARRRVSHLDWSDVIQHTVSAYRELIGGKDSITGVIRPSEAGAMFARLVSALPPGEVKDIIKERIEVAQRKPGPVARFLRQQSLRDRWQALKRVPGSTWIVAGMTIVVSLIGYVFMKGRGKLDGE